MTCPQNVQMPPLLARRLGVLLVRFGVVRVGGKLAIVTGPHKSTSLPAHYKATFSSNTVWLSFKKASKISSASPYFRPAIAA